MEKTQAKINNINKFHAECDARDLLLFNNLIAHEIYKNWQ